MLALPEREGELGPLPWDHPVGDARASNAFCFRLCVFRLWASWQKAVLADVVGMSFCPFPVGQIQACCVEMWP